MIVEYDEKLLKDDDIIQAVVNAGYSASIELDKKVKTVKKEKKYMDNSEILKSMKKRLIISIIFWIPLMYVAMYHMFNEWFNLPIPNFINKIFHGPKNAIAFGFTQFLLLLPIVYVNRNYFISGFKKLFKRAPNMDSLIAIGSSAAIIYGIYAIYMIGYGLGYNNISIVERFSMDLYFESSGTILTLITFGKYLEVKSKGKTGDAIAKLINLAPKTALVERDNVQIEINTEDILVGDILIIKPGTNIPIDGVIISGNSSIDESSITGESIPVQKGKDDTVISGTINKNGHLKVRATKVGNDTTLSQIITLVEEASNSKAPISKLADKVSGIFVPSVILIAIIATIFWLINGQSLEFALSIGIAVLVISCPCALGLATPVAIMVGTGKGAENGILIKSAESLEVLHSVKTVVLDKTGTITEGKPKVTNIESTIDKDEFLKIAASLEQNSEHPLSEAILLEAKNIEKVEVKNFNSVSGRGVEGFINNKKYFGGNIAFMQENNIDTSSLVEKAELFLENGKTVLYFSDETSLLGIIAVSDTIKKDTKFAIDELKKQNIDIVMITGDNKKVASSVAKEVGISKVISEVLPQDKEKEVQKIQSKGEKVAFVGDGINDSPALVRSDVGLAIGSGTDIAIESADIVLIKNSLLDVVNAIRLSKSTINNIKLSLFWAFFYNTIGIPVAAGLFYLNFGFKLNPMIGAAAMSLSSVCVVINALSLKKFKAIKAKEENIIMNKIKIDGMQCNHCKMTVEKVLNSIDGISKVDVSLENKCAIVESTKELDRKLIESKIEEAGFTVTGIE